jgi:RHS repeat-associated protein
LNSCAAQVLRGLWLVFAVLVMGVGSGFSAEVAAADFELVQGPPYTVTYSGGGNGPADLVTNSLAEVNSFLQAQWRAVGGPADSRCQVETLITAPSIVDFTRLYQQLPEIPSGSRFFNVHLNASNVEDTFENRCPDNIHDSFKYTVSTDLHELGNEPDDSNNGDPGCGNAAGGESPGVGDPIHAGTGAVSERETDLSLNSWLTLTRYYNSQAAYDAGNALGRRWRHSYQAALSYDSDSQRVRVTRPCGKVLTFTGDAGAWSPYTAAVTDQLSEIKDAKGNRTGWRYLRSDDYGSEIYALNGQLISIADAAGLTATLSYANGRLASVIDPYGRTIVFAYDSSGRLSQIQPPDGQVIQYTYNDDLLSAVTYPGGAARQYHYDESVRNQSNQNGLLTRISDENSASYAFYSYNDHGLATSAGHAGGADQTTLQYSPWTKGGQGSTTVTYASGLSNTLSFETNNGRMQITGMDVPCNPACDRRYASQFFIDGLLANAEDFKGNNVYYTYSPDGLLLLVSEGDVTSYPNVSRSIYYTWDTALRKPTFRTIFDGTGMYASQTAWVYNTRGQVLARCELTINDASACKATGAPPTGVRRWTYTYCDAADSTACPMVGLLRTATAPNNGTGNTQYSYYLTTDESGCGSAGGACHRAGDLYQVKNPKGHITTIVAYDNNGRVTRISDANKVITDYTYTARGALQSQTVRANADGSASAQDATTSFTYDPAGNLIKLVDADGVAMNYIYDDAHRLTSIVDALGNAIEYTLDAAGNKTAVRITDANGTQHASLTRTFNPLGQLTKVIDGLNQTVFDASTSNSYDANGNLVQSTNARGVSHQSSYDALNRLAQTLDDYQGTDASTQNAQMAYSYDGVDHLTGITDPDGLNTVSTYDSQGNLTKQASPDSGDTTYIYDAAGQVSKRTDANNITASYSYDSLGRVTAKQFPDGKQNLAYFYDEPNSTTGCAGSYPLGRLTRVSEIDVITTYCYDFQGRVIGKTQAAPPEAGELPIRDPIFGNCPPGRMCHHSTGVLSAASTDTPVSDTVGYTYTKAGRLQTLTYPGGLVATYLRDAAGRITGIDLTASDGSQREAVQNVSYLPFGPIATYTLGNGQTITRSYDANYRLADLTSPALSLHYVGDAAGNITNLTEGSTSNTLSYDALGRITSIKDSTGKELESYTYNKTGDRLSKTGSGLATDPYGYQANTHWLTSTGNAARAYDAAGNTTGSSQGGGALGFGYDHLNRLTVVQRDQQTVATYVYNAFGQRIGKVTTDQGLRYAYDENSQLLMEYGGTTDKDYIWLDDVPVAVMDTVASGNGQTSINYVHADGLNTPRALTDESGATIWTWNVAGNPFGEQQPTSSTGYVYNLRYPGQYFDQETGFSYNVNRYFDHTTGRYTQVDPLGYDGGQWSLYTYADNSPLMYVDPYGLFDLPSVPQPVVDFSAGMGDTLSFGVTNWARNRMGTNDMVNQCSTSYSAGEWTGIATSTVIGGAAGWRAAGTKAAGKEFSHWIPNRMGGPRSLWNGNYVSTAEHALSDPYRYRFMPRAWKEANPMPNQVLQQWNRIPNVYMGVSAGAAVGGAGDWTNSSWNSP